LVDAQEISDAAVMRPRQSIEREREVLGVRTICRVAAAQPAMTAPTLRRISTPGAR
jgi:hypothetical protein